MKRSRREFVKTTAASVVAYSALTQSTSLHAATLKLPLGLQLYSVRDLLPTHFAGTLKQLGALGFQEVESAGYYNHTAAEVKQALADAGLKLVSAHYAYVALNKDLDKILDFHHQLGVSYLICSYPGKAKAGDKTPGFSMDDWKWNADQFNTLGDKIKAAGMTFGYHNHSIEFKETDGKTPLVELLERTDPSKVTFEMDCGWVIVGGSDPVQYLRKYPKRFSMLHVKDFKRDAGAKGEPKIEELGLGDIDYRPIFVAAAEAGGIKHCFVEQEGFNVPPMQSLKIDADYMHKIGAA